MDKMHKCPWTKTHPSSFSVIRGSKSMGFSVVFPVVKIEKYIYPDVGWLHQ